jgi:hypothetical protein
MADITITGASVGVNDSGKVIIGQAGSIITRGDVVYLDSSDGKYKLADATDATKANAVGFAQSECAADGYFVISVRGEVAAGATLTKGEIYYLSATADAGAICPFSDLGAGDHVTSVFRATSTTEAELDLDYTEITL